jgi:hypothetical protein
VAVEAGLGDQDADLGFSCHQQHLTTVDAESTGETRHEEPSFDGDGRGRPSLHISSSPW